MYQFEVWRCGRWRIMVLLILICSIQNVRGFLKAQQNLCHISPENFDDRETPLSHISCSSDEKNEDNDQLESDKKYLALSVADITNSVSLDAISRAKTDQCRQDLIETAYLLEHDPEALFPSTLSRTCPLAEASKYRQYVGCYADHVKDRVLKNGYYIQKDTNSIENCIYQCVGLGQELAGVEYGYECFCGSKASLRKTAPLKNANALCETYLCPGNHSESCGGYGMVAIYETGVGKKFGLNVTHVGSDEIIEGPRSIRIVFLLQLAGRSSRQARRMLKLLYRSKHFYYVHVDKRQPYMYREMLKLERILPNFKLKRNRISSAWGSTSLLAMITDSLKDLVDDFPAWDYVINLSESDMPLVSVDVVERLLRKYHGSNFFRSIGNKSMSEFVKDQGFDRLFFECDRRMFLLGERKLPNGLQFDGGSDWYILHRPFVEYAIHGDDELVVGLRKLFRYTLMPTESFFHTLAINSNFCATIADTNLKLINWRRERGCRCQYRHIIDWCGCSPNVIKMDDLDRLEHPVIFNRLDYFARKFDPLVDQRVIRRVEAQVHQQTAEEANWDDSSNDEGPASSCSSVSAYDPESSPGFHAYWENHYDVLDQSIPNLRATDFSTWLLLRSLGRLTLKRIQDADLSTDKLGCTDNILIDTIQRLHIYQVTDVFQGLLVQFNGTCLSADNQQWSLEAYVQKVASMKKFSDSCPLAQALIALEVGRKFDLKEEIFRNYAGAMSIDDEIFIRHHWDTNALKHIEGNRTINFIFQDPTGSAARRYTQTLESPTGVEHFRLPNPKEETLAPGIWTVHMRVGDVIIAESFFLLLPADNEQFEEDPFIDDLISQFYHVDDICQAPTVILSSTSETNGCDFQDSQTESIDRSTDKIELLQCKDTYWSSLSPDPKSEIYGVDRKGVIFPT